MFTHVFKYRVPYPEVDRLNVVHHAHYAKYYEIGRLEMMRSIGWDYKKMEDEGIGLFVVALESKFLRPARFDDELSIVTILSELPSRKVIFKTEILNASNETCNIGHVELLFVNKDKMKVCSIPDAFKELLLPYFENTK
jgi:acyl-CoA thioester hydrolase